MAFHKLWETETGFPRDVDRKFFIVRYWSANHAVFDPSKFPQKEISVFSGKIGVGCFSVDVQFPDESGARLCNNAQVHLAEVIDALYFGIYYPSIVQRFRHVWALGSVASPNSKDLFCPDIFCFGETVISAGLEFLTPAKSGGFIVPALQPVLFLAK